MQGPELRGATSRTGAFSASASAERNWCGGLGGVGRGWRAGWGAEAGELCACPVHVHALCMAALIHACMHAGPC